MSDKAFNAGASFGSVLKNLAAIPANVMSGHIADPAFGWGAQAGAAAAPNINDFLIGLTGAPRPSVTVPLPPLAAPTQGKGTPAAAGGKGTPTTPNTTTAAAPGGVTLTPDQLAQFGKLSFGQLATLGRFSDETKGYPTSRSFQPASDIAANLIMQNTYPTFKAMMDAEPDQTKKQSIVDKYNKDVLLPLALRGNVGSADMATMMAQAQGAGGQ